MVIYRSRGDVAGSKKKHRYTCKHKTALAAVLPVATLKLLDVAIQISLSHPPRNYKPLETGVHSGVPGMIQAHRKIFPHGAQDATHRSTTMRRVASAFANFSLRTTAP